MNKQTNTNIISRSILAFALALIIWAPLQSQSFLVPISTDNYSGNTVGFTSIATWEGYHTFS